MVGLGMGWWIEGLGGEFGMDGGKNKKIRK